MKKIPLRVYFMIAMALLAGVVSVFLIVRIVQNHDYVVAYANDDYLTEKEEGLLKLNAPESYLPYYNLGNAAFQNMDYNSAIGYFTQALSLFPMGQKECDVRVNLALSMCYSIDFDKISSQESIDSALLILYRAKDILLENNWATENGEDYRDEDAQQLKEDIDKMIEKLKESGDDSNDQDDQEEQKQQNNQDDSDNQQGQSDKEKRQKEKLEENKKNALEERRQQREDMEKWSTYGGGDEDGDGGSGGGTYKPW